LLAHLAKGKVSFYHHLARVVRRLSFVVCRPLTIHILIFSSETPQPNEVKLSHQSSAHLAKQFQRIRLLEIGQSETRIICGDHVCQQIEMKCAIVIEDLP
jgi:hypothetical protein